METAEPAPEASAEEVCAICLDALEDDDVVRLPDCLHLFHADCLHPWLKQRNTCPLCKQPAISRVYPRPATAGPGARVGHRTAAFHGGAQRAQPGGARGWRTRRALVFDTIRPAVRRPPRKHQAYAPLTALL